jgi:hypothetical protein
MPASDGFVSRYGQYVEAYSSSSESLAADLCVVEKLTDGGF